MPTNLLKMKEIAASPATDVVKIYFESKIITMKKIIFLQLLLIATPFAFPQNTIQAPPAWGHYKKLSALSAKPARGMDHLTHFISFLRQAKQKLNI